MQLPIQPKHINHYSVNISLAPKSGYMSCNRHLVHKHGDDGQIGFDSGFLLEVLEGVYDRPPLVRQASQQIAASPALYLKVISHNWFCLAVIMRLSAKSCKSEVVHKALCTDHEHPFSAHPSNEKGRQVKMLLSMAYQCRWWRYMLQSCSIECLAHPFVTTNNRAFWHAGRSLVSGHLHEQKH